MKIAGFIWLEEIVQKLIWKHSVETEEVSEIFLNNLKFVLLKKGIEKTKMFMRHSVKPMRDAIWLVTLFVKKTIALLFCRQEI